MRETAFTFRCYDYLCLSVSLLKVVKQVVQSFDLGGFFFLRGSGHSRSYLVVSGCHDLYSTALQQRAQLDQFWPDSHVWHQRGEVRRLGRWLLLASSERQLLTRGISRSRARGGTLVRYCGSFLIFLNDGAGMCEWPALPCHPCSDEGEEANRWPSTNWYLSTH